MFGGHTAKRIQSVPLQETSDGKSTEFGFMDLFVAVGILFSMGYLAGFGLRSLSANKQSRYRPMSSLRDFDYREDPVWTR